MIGYDVIMNHAPYSGSIKNVFRCLLYCIALYLSMSCSAFLFLSFMVKEKMLGT